MCLAKKTYLYFKEGPFFVEGVQSFCCHWPAGASGGLKGQEIDVASTTTKNEPKPKSIPMFLAKT